MAEQGTCTIQGSSGGSGGASSLLTGGLWQNVSATSLLTGGLISGGSGSVDPNCFLGVIRTSRGPLTRGFGSAELARPQDVVVRVNGSPRNVLAVHPASGLIILENNIEGGANVEVDYYYTPGLKIPMSQLGSEAYKYNQAGVNTLYSKFEFTPVFGPDQGRDQPVQIGHTFTGMQRGYTPVLNDPTTLRFNEPFNRPSPAPLSETFSEVILSYDGGQEPQSPWQRVGPSTPFELEEGLFILDDLQGSTDLVSSEPLFYRQISNLYPDDLVTINFRLKVFSYEKAGDFTGISVGYTSSKGMTFLGLLEVGGITFAGFLKRDGEETRWQDYLGLPAQVHPFASSGTPVYSRLRYEVRPSLLSGDQVFIEGAVYEVTALEIDESNGIYDVILDQGLSPSFASQTVQTYPEVDFQTLTSYRIAKSFDNKIRLFVGGFPNAVALASPDDLALGPEVFELLTYNQVFFGSVSRQAKARAGFDFVRFSLAPKFPSSQSAKVKVDLDTTTLPENAAGGAWSILDGYGYTNPTPASGLILEQNSRSSEGLNGYGKVEPLLSSQASFDLQAELRVESFATCPGTLLKAALPDKELSLGFFATDLNETPFDFTTYSVFQGVVSIVDPAEVAELGGSPRTSAWIQDSTIPRFKGGYNGTDEFADEGWVESGDPITSTFVDRYHRIQKSQGQSFEAVQDVPLLGLSPFDSHLFSARLKIDDYSLDSNGATSIRFGVNDDQFEISLTFVEIGGVQKVAFADPSGNPYLDIFNNPIGVDFDWSGDWHHYRVLRTPANIVLFIDGDLQGTFSFQAPVTPNQTHSLHFRLGSELVDMSLDYFFAHSTSYAQEHIGVYRGGNPSRRDSYDLIPYAWAGQDIEVRFHVDLKGSTKVFLGGSGTPSFEYQSADLPDRTDHDFGLNTEYGYVAFGALEPSSFSKTIWKSLRYQYTLNNQGRLSLQHSKFNAGYRAQSAEALEDLEPDVIEVLSTTSTSITLSDKGYNALRVLTVTDLDETQQYSFSFDVAAQEITLDAPLASDRESVLVRYIAGKPYTMKYLLAQTPATLLNEGTPPFELTLQKKLDISTDPVDPDQNIFGNSTDYTYMDGQVIVTFSVNDNALIESLDLRSVPDDGKLGLLASASDAQGWIQFDLDPWDDLQDQYEIPDQGEGKIFREPLILGDINSLLGQNIFTQDPFIGVTIETNWIEEDVYQGVTEDLPEGTTVAITGFLLGSVDSTTSDLNSTIGTYSEGAPVAIPFEFS